MSCDLSLTTFLVREYDEAINFFTDKLGFELLEDTPLTEGKRWVRVAPKQSGGAALLLAKATNSEQLAAVGNQTGGRVAYFLETDDFGEDYRAMKSKGVQFLEEPREEAYGMVVVFIDLYGNKWDLLQLNKS
jgi:catechol 2,3-dioxygenase-like lactoylglutathione lyase family enzyme